MDTVSKYIDLSNEQYWSTELIQKYDLSGPRYTSYPSALYFEEAYTERDWLNASCLINQTKQGDQSAKPISLYLHIPFCDTICYYCGCNKIVTANRVHAKKYVEALADEIRLKAALIPQNTQVDMIHFGGGTPTYLSNEQLQMLLETLSNSFQFVAKKPEVAIEIHPQSVDPVRLEKLRNLGFNRISIGIQDFAVEVQKAVNRYSNKNEVETLIKTARDLGYISCSVDLIYGLPCQSSSSFAQTLEDVIALAPDRMSIFNYAHLPEQFKSQRQIDATKLPSPEEKLSILYETIKTLTSSGYAYIGMDHFAKLGDELDLAQKTGTLHRNFQGYSTNNAPVIHGFGVSAISTLHHHYCQNVKTLDKYYELIDQKKLPIKQGYKLNRDDEIRRYVINSLLCHSVLDFATLNTLYGIRFFDYFSNLQQELSILKKDGLIAINDDSLSILPKGRLLARSVCKIFDIYLNSKQATSRRFSRII